MGPGLLAAASSTARRHDSGERRVDMPFARQPLGCARSIRSRVLRLKWNADPNVAALFSDSADIWLPGSVLFGCAGVYF